MFLYADDMAEFYAAGEEETLSMVKSDTEIITKWTKSNKICLNKQKCQSITLGNRISYNSNAKFKN